MIVLGIDPGYDRVGWAILEENTKGKCSVIECGCIQTKKTDEIFLRYKSIITQLQENISKYQPEILAIESIFFSNNQKTAIRVSEARGVILGALIPSIDIITEYTPNQIKLAVTGYGNADKAAVEKMVKLQVALPNAKLIDDTIDAIAIAFTQIVSKVR